MSFSNKISSYIGKVSLWTKKNSPELLVATGIVAAAASIILGCKATTKLEKETTPTIKKINKLREEMKDSEKIATGEVVVNDHKKEMVVNYGKLALKVVKLYTPTVLMFSLAVSSMLYSHKILKARNVALAAAYTTIDKAFDSYRERVKKRFGEDVEREIRYDIHEEETVKEEINENGEVIQVKSKRKVYGNTTDNGWSVLFDELNPFWEKSGAMNFTFLQAKEFELNRLLKTRGYVFLYEVYDELGVNLACLGPDKLQGSHVVGWIYDPDDQTRDNYISFGLVDRNGHVTEAGLDMKADYERSALIELNPDGDILTGSKGKKTFMGYIKDQGWGGF